MLGLHPVAGSVRPVQALMNGDTSDPNMMAYAAAMMGGAPGMSYNMQVGATRHTA